jgi:hypothetical protein
LSCSKKIEETPTNLEQPKVVNLTADTKYLVNGTDAMTYAQFTTKYSSTNNGPDLVSTEPSIIIDFNGNNYIFTNDANLLTWANATPGAIVFKNKLDEITNWQNYAAARGMLNNEALTMAYTDSLINANPSPNYQLFSGLYDLNYYEGDKYTYTGLLKFYPTLGRFNDRASSIFDRSVSFTVNILASRTWFLGKKFFYRNLIQIPVLRAVNFDNTARSKI